MGILARCLTFPVKALTAYAERTLVYLGQHASDGLTKSSFSPATFDKLKAMSMSAKNISHVSFTGLPINMVA